MYFTDVHPYVGLRCRIVEKGASPTYFCDMKAAWAGLPEDLKEKVKEEGIVDYSLKNFFDRARYPYDVQKPSELRYLRMTRKCKGSIYRNDKFGEYAYFSPLYTSSKYYDELCELLFQDKYIYEHEWNTGDLAIWNNITLSHMRKGTPRTIVRNLVRYAFHEPKQNEDYLTHLPIKYDKDQLIKEAKALDYKPFEVKRAPKDSWFRYAPTWLRSEIKEPTGEILDVVNQVKDLFKLEDKDFTLNTFDQKANTSVPAHKDISPCAIIIILADNYSPISFTDHGDINYQCALLNTQEEHSVKSYIENRLTLKFSIQTKSYEEMRWFVTN